MRVDSQNCTIISIGSIGFDPPIPNFHSRCSQQLVSYWHLSFSATLTHFMLVLWYNNTDAVDENKVMKLWSIFVGCKCDYEYVRGNNNRGCKNNIYKSIIISHMSAICHLTFSKKKNKRDQRLKNVCIYSSLFFVFLINSSWLCCDILKDKSPKLDR